MKTRSKGDQPGITPALALEWLKKGNQRFAINMKFKRKILVQAHHSPGKRGPFAYVLSCTDSHTPAERIFDQESGDIFCMSAAGNAINNKILASMEFACKVAGSKLIVVLGHTHCGAIRNTCNQVEIDSLTALLVKFQPAFYSNFVDKVAAVSIKRAVQAIQTKSPILTDMIKTGKIGVIGGCYDSASGKVDFFDDTFVIRQPVSTTKTKKRKKTELKQPLTTVEKC